MFSNFKLYSVIVISLILSSCDSSNDESVTTSSDLKLNKTSITFDVNKKTNLPVSQTISASWTNTNVAAIVIAHPTGTIPPTWLEINTSGKTSPLNIDFSVKDLSMPSGTHTAIVKVISVDKDSKPLDTLDVNVTLNLNSTLSISGNSLLTFKMLDSGLVPLDQTIDLVGDKIDWTAVTSTSWVTLKSKSGTTPSTVSIGVNPSTLAIGLHTATVDFTNTATGKTTTLNVELQIGLQKLVVADNGIAFSSMPGLSNLTQQVTVNTSANINVPWTASSNKPWLTATANGTTGGTITISANPNGLTVDSIHYAEISVSSTDSSIANTEIIKVGFWVGATDPTANVSLAKTYEELTTDPIRPYVYMNNKGSSIDVYNIHTASLVATISNVGAQLGDMEVSSDGSMLYVADLTNYDIIPITLDTMTVETKWDLTGSGNLWLAYGRVNTKSIIFTSHGKVYDADSGTTMTNTFEIGTYYYSGSVLTVSQNGKKMCGVLVGLSPYTIECFKLDYSDIGAGTLTMTSLNALRGPGSNAKDVALTNDGSRAYVSSGAPYTFIGFDTETMLQDQTLPADAYPVSVEISSGNLLYGGISGSYGPLDAWIYNTNGVLQNSYYLSGYAKNIRDRQLVVSGDGLRMIASVTDPAIKIVTTQ